MNLLMNFDVMHAFDRASVRYLCENTRPREGLT